jgi:D-glycero-beta-D-manno-heptose-7-phosphate kinase
MKTEELSKLFEKFDRFNILIIGDVMIDSYLWGKVDRISPEAPVPIISRTEIENRLGGAANVALNIKSLGANPILCSVIGKDEKAPILMDLLNKSNMSCEGIFSHESRTTTIKTRVICDNHHLLRIDEETTRNISAEIEREFLEIVTKIVSQNKIDAVIFQDYDKGVITPNIIHEVVKIANERSIPTLVDPKKRNFLNFKGVTLFKPNFKELVEGLKIDIRKGDFKALHQASLKLQDEQDIKIVMTTLSELGVYITDCKAYQVIPAEIRDIADVSGAGDTVISTAGLCLAAGLKPEDIASISNIAGGLVCERVGVVPIEKAILYDECIKLLKFDKE